MANKRKKIATPAAASVQPESSTPLVIIGAHVDASIGSNTQTETQIEGPSQSGVASSGEVVDHYAGVEEIHYCYEQCKRVKKGNELPAEPPLERRPVLTDINKGGYYPTKYHKDGLRITRIIIERMKSDKATWMEHDEEKRKDLFGIFQNYFAVSDDLFKAWSSKASVTYKHKMGHKRKLGRRKPEVKSKDEALWQNVWEQPKWIEKSIQAKANRAKNPCGNRQHYLGRKGLNERSEEFHKKHGLHPNPVQRCEMQFVKRMKTSVPDEDGVLHEDETVVYANPHSETAMAKIVEDVAILSQPVPTQPDSVPTPPTDLEQKKIIAKHFGIGKRGNVIGLGTDAAEVVPASSQRSSRIDNLEIRQRQLEDQLSSVVEEMETLRQKLEDQSRQLAEMEKQKLEDQSRKLAEMEKQKLAEAVWVAEMERQQKQMQQQMAAIMKKMGIDLSPQS